MALVPVTINAEEYSVSVAFGNVVSGKKGETVKLPEALAKWEEASGRVSYVKKNEDDPKK